MTRSAQPSLFPVAAQPRSLTDRQSAALDLLTRAGADELAADELGAALCELRGRHAAGDRCAFDKQNGLGVLRALRTKGYARARRDGTWRAISSDAEAGSGELPEGF